jgi:hypothetical protein
MAKRRSAPTEAEFGTACYLQTLVEAAEGAKALGWDEVVAYCHDRAAVKCMRDRSEALAKHGSRLAGGTP